MSEHTAPEKPIYFNGHYVSNLDRASSPGIQPRGSVPRKPVHRRPVGTSELDNFSRQQGVTRLVSPIANKSEEFDFSETTLARSSTFNDAHPLPPPVRDESPYAELSPSSTRTSDFYETRTSPGLAPESDSSGFAAYSTTPSIVPNIPNQSNPSLASTGSIISDEYMVNTIKPATTLSLSSASGSGSMPRFPTGVDPMESRASLESRSTHDVHSSGSGSIMSHYNQTIQPLNIQNSSVSMPDPYSNNVPVFQQPSSVETVQKRELNHGGENFNEPSPVSKHPSPQELGIGTGSAYVNGLRKKSGTVISEVSPNVWELPVGISDKGKSSLSARSFAPSQMYMRRAMDIKHSHLTPRLLASEMDDEDEDDAATNSPDVTSNPQSQKLFWNSNSNNAAYKISPTSSSVDRASSVTTTSVPALATPRERSTSVESIEEQVTKIRLFVANPDD